MADEGISARCRHMLEQPISSSWFTALRALYEACNPEQRQWLRTRLGYGEPWPVPDSRDWFAATWIERHPELLDPVRLKQAVIEAATHSDSRERNGGLCLLYHLTILLGLDPDALFSEAAAEVEADAAQKLREFLKRSPNDRNLEAFDLTAARDAAGRIMIECA